MKLNSFSKVDQSLHPIEIEVSLFPGIPQIHFLGLPDQVIKESLHRIRSAIKNHGYEWPQARQIVVNLRPNHLKKSSRGIELAVAVGILCETGQLKLPMESENDFFYGELGLSGDVYEPEDLQSLSQVSGHAVWTGQGEIRSPFRKQKISTLAELNHPVAVAPSDEYFRVLRPQHGLEKNYSAREAKLLKLWAVGEHSTLLAGDAGSGKSTLAKCALSFLRAPTREDFLDRLVAKSFRPFYHPHHSIPYRSMIGGGSPPQPGEITRAHRGMLLLDELGEFDSSVQEALREPLEEKKICLSRGNFSQEFAADFFLVATTNLCPCGRWIPGKAKTCSYSVRRCESVLQKFSGPFLDRIEILQYCERNTGDRDISGKVLFGEIEKLWMFQAQLPVDEEVQLPKVFVKSLEQESARRKNAVVRVARSLATLDCKDELKAQHFEEAWEMCITSFRKLSNV